MESTCFRVSEVTQCSLTVKEAMDEAGGGGKCWRDLYKRGEREVKVGGSKVKWEGRQDETEVEVKGRRGQKRKKLLKLAKILNNNIFKYNSL